MNPDPRPAGARAHLGHGAAGNRASLGRDVHDRGLDGLGDGDPVRRDGRCWPGLARTFGPVLAGLRECSEGEQGQQQAGQNRNRGAPRRNGA